MNYLDRTDSFMRDLGVEAYRVGGSVRDELLGRRVKDADYMVRGVGLDKLGQLLALNHRVSISKLKLRDGRHAGWRASAPGLGLIEIMLPRTDKPRAPRPGENVHRAFDIVVDPNLTLREDAFRRDFTFNALYKIVHDGQSALNVLDDGNGTLIEDVVDPTGKGLYDLSHKIVRTTHPDSFRDDPLRTLRALRFVSALGYDLSTETENQMLVFSDAVTGLSANGYASGTVLDEMSKLLMGDEPAKALRLMRKTGVLAYLFPGLAPMLHYNQGSRYHDLTTDEHTFKALETAAHVNAPLRVRWALLFHDAGKPDAAWVGKDGRKHYYAPSDDQWYDVCLADGAVHQGGGSVPPKPLDHEVLSEAIWHKTAEWMNAPRSLVNDVALLIREHMVPLEGKFKASKVRRGRVKFGDEFLRDLYMHRACDEAGKGKPDKQRMERIALMEAERARCERVGVPSTPKDLAITGNDLKDMGLDGRDIGRVLRAVLDEVAVDPRPLQRSREWQFARAAQLAKEPVEA